MKKRLIILIIILFILLFGIFLFLEMNRVYVTGNVVNGPPYVYSTPLDYLAKQINVNAADPFVLAEGGFYYLYLTGVNNIPIYKSNNFIDWTYIGNAFVADNIWVSGKLGWDTMQQANYKYTNLWAPELINFNGFYVLTFTGTQSPPVASNTLGQSIWLAYSSISPVGPFGPANNQRMHEPVPIRNYKWGFNITQPHTILLPDSQTAIGDSNSMKIDSSFFTDTDGSMWMSYVFYSVGNEISIVKLDSSDISLTSQTSPESFNLTNNKDVKPGPACNFYDYTNKVDYVQSVCITEAPEIIIHGGKYILFYSVNAYDSNSYSIYYKMANSLRCLEHGKENDENCGVKQGVAFDGINSVYSYGHGTLVEGPNGEQLFHVLTVMKDSDKSYRNIWVVEQQFNSDGTPKYSTPQINDLVNINLNQPLSCVNQTCDNNPANGILDSQKICSGTFDSVFTKNSYKTMTFTNGWAYVDGEWVSNMGGGWYWFQGNCSLGTYSRYIYINIATGAASGLNFNCSQDGQNYCTQQPLTPVCTSFNYSSWTQCNSSALQTKTIISKSPSGCTGGNSESLIQQCLPPCSLSNWQSTDSVCLSSNTLTRTWTKIGNCNLTIGINKPTSETIVCSYVPNTVTCINFTYSNWGECLSNGIINRSLVSSLPANCTGGNPILVESCNYSSPVINDFDDSSSSDSGDSGGSSSNSDYSDLSFPEQVSLPNQKNTNEVVINLTNTAGDYKSNSFFQKFICNFLRFFNRNKVC